MLDFVDIGANLTHDSFDPDRDALISRAVAAGVTRMIVTGTSESESARAVALAATSPGQLYATVGIHPHHAKDFQGSSRNALAALLREDCVVAVGECGLDYYRDFSPRHQQIEAFDAQLELAAEVNMPVFLHQRDAHDDFVAAIQSARSRLVGGVAHCFTQGITQVESYLDLGLYIGITGWVCDERRGTELQAALPHIPLDRLLLETDAPYLLPRSLHPKPKSRRNEPAHLVHIAERVALLMGCDVEEVAAAATRNAEQLFSIGKQTVDADTRSL
jgi:TatD DNase family protein